MKVLIVPAHMSLDYKRFGSESLSVYIILKKLQDIGIDFLAVVGYSPDYCALSEKRIIKVNHVSNPILFHTKSSITLVKLLMKSNEKIIHHHMLPFSFYKGINLMISSNYMAFYRSKVYKSVLGPIPYPIFRPYEDESLWIGEKNMFINKLATHSKLVDILHNKTLKNVEVIIFDSYKGKELFEKMYNTSSLKFVLPFPIDIENLPFSPTIYERDEIRIASVGGLRYVKHHEFLIPVIKVLREEYQFNVKGFILGDGPLKNVLEKWIKKFNLEDYIRVISHPRDEFISFVSKNVDVIVNFSESEGMLPTSLREAMALGKVVFTTPSGAIEEHIIDGYNGYLIRDIWDLISKISNLRPRTAKKVVNNARRYAYENFSADNFVKKLLEIYFD